jgi:hypothetical protein
MGAPAAGRYNLREEFEMTKLLQEAFDQASLMPEDEQDALARWLLQELASDRRWDESFSRSQDKLADMAKEARKEYHAGETEDLDPDRL